MTWKNEQDQPQNTENKPQSEWEEKLELVLRQIKKNKLFLLI
jgi:hypothetical protein